MGKKTKPDSDLQGISRLLTAATLGITDIVEEMHQQVVHPPFLPSTPIQHLITKIAGFTYSNIRWSTQLIGGGLDKLLGQLAPLLGELKKTDEREALRAALNGVVGDYLEAKDNPLKIKMQFRFQSKPLSLDAASLKKVYPKVNGKILLLVHGSCSNDIQWTRHGHNHGSELAKDLNQTPVYLHYNSGRHISDNGQNFKDLIEELLLHWPVPVEEVQIIAHSMGGLVTRSALHYAQQEKKAWLPKLKKVIFLGTPHQGAFLEKAGNYLDVILEAVPYAKPFARLGKTRSAGVSDLRYGNLVAEDWQEDKRFELQGDQRKPIPLPKKIACYSIAAVLGKSADSLAPQILGDGLVSVQSALGKHSEASKQLNFKKKNTWIAFEHSHLDLLDRQETYTQIKEWLQN